MSLKTPVSLEKQLSSTRHYSLLYIKAGTQILLKTKGTAIAVERARRGRIAP